MQEDTKKRMKIPHTYIILIFIVLFVSILTYIIPAGQFERAKDPVSGRTLIVPGTYHVIDPSPVSPLSIPVEFFNTLTKENISEIIFFIFIVGGAFELIIRTGMISAFCGLLGRKMAGREKFVIPIFVVLFSICGFTMGMSVEVLIFVPIGIAVARSIGYDIMTGTAMIVMGSIIGFTAGIYNPFNVGVAQVIAQLPLFSGSWLRWILLAVLVVVTCWYITHYAVKVKRDPSKDLLADVDMSHVPDVEFLPVTTRHKLILLTVVAGFSILIYGVSSLDWFIVEMAATFLVMGVVCGFIGGMTANEICDIFVSGASQITYGALIVGVAGTIQTVMIDGKIIDTIVNSLVNTVVLLPGYLQIVAMFLVQTIINLPINSGTGQAAATMPIMIPVADLLGISRQSAVLAFQLGDGFTNAVYPTSSTMLGFLAASRIPYDKWLKYAIPLVGIYSVVSIVFLVIAQFIAY